jgi:hypothetical protein
VVKGSADWRSNECRGVLDVLTLKIRSNSVPANGNPRRGRTISNRRTPRDPREAQAVPQTQRRAIDNTGWLVSSTSGSLMNCALGQQNALGANRARRGGVDVEIIRGIRRV